jgi:hypothetical protein
MDPQFMREMSAQLQRLPKGQLQKLQAIMQRAMAGKDVSKEAAEWERGLPLSLQEFFRNSPMVSQMMQSQMGQAAAAPAETAVPQTEEEARKVIEEAVREGRLSAEEAKAVLEGSAGAISDSAQEDQKKPSFWKGLLGKKKQ